MPEKKENSVGASKAKSSLSEFIERPLASDMEVKEFEAKIDRSLKKGSGDELLEIYEDAQGNIIDVKKITIKRRHVGLRLFFKSVFLIIVLGLLAYGAYSAYNKFYASRVNMLDLVVTVPNEIKSGDEFFYNLEYKNLTNSNLGNIKVEVTYPDNFIFIDSLPSPVQNKNTWEISNLDPKSSGSIKVKGKIINSEGKDNLFLAKANYYLDSFSTEFKREVASIVKIKGLGFKINFNYASTALVGEDNEIYISFGDYETVPNMANLVLGFPENMTLIGGEATAEGTTATSSENLLSWEKITDDTWRLSNFKANIGNQNLRIKYRIKEKTDDQQKITLRLEEKAQNDKYYPFVEKEIIVDVIKSNLNLSLSLNGEKGDQNVNFNDTLNYSLSYSNKGDSLMKDVVIMAVLNSDFLDWGSVKDKNNGQKKKGLITWTRNEIPELRELEAGKEGTIDFSIKVADFNTSDLGKNFTIKSYAQFSIGNSEELKEGSDNKSNEINSRINSDLNFTEQIRYFDEDNVPVGDGPLPPQVGQKTSLKVYWKITNNLHELNNVSVEYQLPASVYFDNRAQASVGSINYDGLSNKIIWTIGRLPLTVYNANAEFNIAVSPNNNDRNKIMVISGGTVISALDVDTQETIIKSSSVQTTRLDDDDIASMNNDGRVQ
ncbi:MAG: hypothetical protein WC564_02785 [Patescibacteria group bacterium]